MKYGYLFCIEFTYIHSLLLTCYAMVNVSQQIIIDFWFYCDNSDAPYKLCVQYAQCVLALPLLEVRRISYEWNYNRYQ